MLGAIQVEPETGIVGSNTENSPFGNGDPSLKVHAGFLQIWRGLRSLLHKTAELASNPLYKDYKITFVGHSLGKNWSESLQDFPLYLSFKDRSSISIL